MPAEPPIVQSRHGKRGARRTDRLLADLAAQQHGVVERQQLLALGIRRGSIEARLDRRQLHPIHRGVYAVGHELVSLEGGWMAAVLASGRGSFLSHRSAGRLWRLLPQHASLPEVTRPGGWRASPGIRTHRSQLRNDETDLVLGIPVTSLSRTLLDLAAVLSWSKLEHALNEAERLRLTDRVSLPELLRRHPGRRGIAKLRVILADPLAGVVRSELEARFRSLVTAWGLPRPEVNVLVPAQGRVHEVDCLWRSERLIVELDGRAFHDTSAAFHLDRERDRRLAAAGWRVVRLTWRQLHDDAAAVAADLRGLLGTGTAPYP
jgi:hypothetical protein